MLPSDQDTRALLIRSSANLPEDVFKNGVKRPPKAPKSKKRSVNDAQLDVRGPKLSIATSRKQVDDVCVGALADFALSRTPRRKRPDVRCL